MPRPCANPPPPLRLLDNGASWTKGGGVLHRLSCLHLLFCVARPLSSNQGGEGTVTWGAFSRGGGGGRGNRHARPLTGQGGARYLGGPTRGAKKHPFCPPFVGCADPRPWHRVGALGFWVRWEHGFPEGWLSYTVRILTVTLPLAGWLCRDGRT